MTSIIEAIITHAKAAPQKLCLADIKQEVSYEQFLRHILGYAAHLTELGVKKGDCVVIEAMNQIGYLVSAMAVQYLGGIFVPLEKNAAESRIVEIIEKTGANVYLARSEMLKDRKFESRKQVLDFYEEGEIDYGHLSLPEGKKIAEILFSTGTTGTSKGIEMQHSANVAVAENVKYGVEMQEDTMELIPVPMNHSHGLRTFYGNMLNGSSCALLDGVVYTKRFFALLDNYPITAIDLVPAALATIFELSGDRLGNYADRLQYIELGSAPIPAADKERLCRLLPKTRLYNFYGSTEAGRSCVLDFNKENKPSCIGRPAKNAEFIFVDEQRQKITATKEQPGFLATSGSMCMKGYYQEPQLTAETLIDGFIYSQDLSYMDEDGCIVMLGRQGDVINTGGNKVAPDEIEEAAKGMEEIADCACIPVPDKIMGEVPKLYVQLAAGAEFDSEKIASYIKGKLEGYKIPKIIEPIDLIPRTYNGKIQRKKLIEKNQGKE